MSAQLMRRMYDLRERSKSRLNIEVNRTVDEMFDLVLGECFPGKKLPPLSTFSAPARPSPADELNSEINNHFNRLKTVSKQSIIDAALPDSNTGLQLFNSVALREIFSKDFRPPTTQSAGYVSDSEQLASPHGSDCDCDQCMPEQESDYEEGSLYTQNYSVSDLPGLLAEINQEVFAEEKKPKSSLLTNSNSPTESHFIIPTTHNGVIGPITPPKKCKSSSTKPASFANIVATAAKSPTPNKLVVNGNGSSKSSTKVVAKTKNNNVDKTNGAEQYHDYSHQFKTRYVKCFVGNCKQSFAMMPLLNTHLKDVHKVHKHRCPISTCGMSYVEVQEYTTHVHQNHFDINEWVCEKCGEKFEHHRALGQHNYFYHQEGWFECKNKDCSVGARNRGAIIHHCKTVHNQGSTDPEYYFHLLSNPPNEPKVNNKPVTTENIRPPRDQQFETRAVYCVIQNCTEKVRTVEDLNVHLKDAHEKSPCFCPIYRCAETFDKMCQMDLHVLRDHGNLTQWRCGLCAFIGRDHRQLSAHIYWCHCEGEYKCVECPKVGRYRNDVTAHFSSTH